MVGRIAARYGPGMTQDTQAEQLPYERFENLLNPCSVAKLASRFYRGASEAFPAREEVGRHRTQVAEPALATLELLRTEPYRLRHEGSCRGRSPC
jgi:hypothetical protein